MGWANDWVAYASAKSHFLTGSDDQRGTTGVVFVQIAPGIHQKSILSFLVGDDHQRLALLQVEEENRLKEKVASAFDERRKKTGLKIVDFEESATWKQSLLSRHPESSRRLLGRADLGGGWVPVFDPTAWWRLRWDVFVCGVLLVCVVVTPFEMAFLRHEPDPWGAFSVLLFALDVAFLCDFCITFNTAVLVDGELCSDRRVIAAHYLRTWACVDLVASIPFSAALREVPGGGKLSRQTRFTRMLKALKFSRLVKVGKIIAMLESMDEWDDDPAARVYADVKHFTGLITMVCAPPPPLPEPL